MSNIKVGFIGAGKMGGAIINGLISSGFALKENIMASEVNEEAAKRASEILGVKVICNNKELVKNSDIVFVAIKPFVIREVLKPLVEDFTADKLLVSIAAGTSTSTIETLLPQAPVVRVMPNTPALVNEGMSVFCLGSKSDRNHAQIVDKMLSCIGRSVEIPENLMDAATGISGSGPAFMYLIIEALAKGGVNLGLSEEVAKELAAQTMIGAAKMAFETDKDLVTLRKEVTTPGGCTEQGLIVLEEKNIRLILEETVEKTAEKAEELGRGN